MINRISLIENRPTQADLDDVRDFCKAMRKVGVLDGLEWHLRALEDWWEHESESLRCEGKGYQD